MFETREPSAGGSQTLSVLRISLVWSGLCLLAGFAQAADSDIENGALRVTASNTDGSYTIMVPGKNSPIVQAQVSAEVDHRWIRADAYRTHEVVRSEFEDALGPGHQIKVISTGLPDLPDLIYTIRLYAKRPYGDIQVQVQNQGQQTSEIQSIRPVEAVGGPILDLGGDAASDRVLSDSFSEDWPPLLIYDLGKAPKGVHRAVGSQLIYNQQSRASVFFGALTSERFLTILHLRTKEGANGANISAFTVDSTGTTEIQATEEESGLREGPAENLIELSLPLSTKETMTSERLMFSAGSDYHALLENYGSAISTLHHSRIPENNLLGWWSWTAFYTKITEGNTFTNALWLAENLKSLGYDYFHFDLGYGYSRGEYATPNASQFPHGMQALTQRIRALGLRIGVWTAPFEVGERSSVYEQHKDWLVRNARGEPIPVTTAEESPGERLFVLDATNSAAQEFLRQTYRTLVRDWGVNYIKLDFMDNTAIEGHYSRANTTSLEAQRIGLQVIRETVGDEVLLDKDGSPMLNPVGMVDTGRVSQDTGHTFLRSKEAAPGIAARYYMNRTFFLNDPDAFTLSRQLLEEREIQAPLTLSEAQVSIALSAVSGGMYEIGDDLPTLGRDADRGALLKNAELLQIVKLGRAAIPLDLMNYRNEDEQPSVFLLQEDARQSVLGVFNWTDHPQTHRFPLSYLALPAGHAYQFVDIFDPQHHWSAQSDLLEVDQPAHSVKLIKIIDSSVPPAPPSVAVQIPDHAKANEVVKFSCHVDDGRVPALTFHWDFGDGTSENTRQAQHTYTLPAEYRVRLVVEGVDGTPAQLEKTMSVSGVETYPPATRYGSQK